MGQTIFGPTLTHKQRIRQYARQLTRTINNTEQRATKAEDDLKLMWAKMQQTVKAQFFPDDDSLRQMTTDFVRLRDRRRQDLKKISDLKLIQDDIERAEDDSTLMKLQERASKVMQSMNSSVSTADIKQAAIRYQHSKQQMEVKQEAIQIAMERDNDNTGSGGGGDDIESIMRQLKDQAADQLRLSMPSVGDQNPRGTALLTTTSKTSTVRQN